MRDKLKTGITNTSYGVYGRFGRYDKIKRSGYNCIDFQEFANIYTDFFKLPIDEFEAELIKEREYLESLGLRVNQAHAPWVGDEPRDRTPEERAAWLEAMKKAIYGTHVLGAPRFVVHPLLPYDDSDKNSEEVIALNDEFIGEVADYARPYGVTVCVENLPFMRHPVSTVEAVCDLVDRLGRDNLKICLDTGHAAMFNKDVSAAVRYIGSRLDALHVHDNMGDSDAHLIPGEGVIDWDAFAASLGEIGYTGVVSLETGPKHGAYPESEWEEREARLAAIADDISTKAGLCG